MGIFDSETSTTNNNPIADLQASYLSGIYGAANDLYNQGAPGFYPGSTVAAFDPVRAQGLNLGVDAALGSQTGLANNQSDLLNNILSGNDPYTNQLAQQAAANTASSFGQAGSLGSARNYQQSNLAASNAILGRQLDASQQVNQAQQNALAPSNTLRDIGTDFQTHNQNIINADKQRYDFQADQPWDHLERYQGIITTPSASAYNEGSTSSTSPSLIDTAIGIGTAIAGLPINQGGAVSRQKLMNHQSGMLAQGGMAPRRHISYGMLAEGGSVSGGTDTWGGLQSIPSRPSNPEPNQRSFSWGGNNTGQQELDAVINQAFNRGVESASSSSPAGNTPTAYSNPFWTNRSPSSVNVPFPTLSNPNQNSTSSTTVPVPTVSNSFQPPAYDWQNETQAERRERYINDPQHADTRNYYINKHGFDPADDVDPYMYAPPSDEPSPWTPEGEAQRQAIIQRYGSSNGNVGTTTSPTSGSNNPFSPNYVPSTTTDTPVVDTPATGTPAVDVSDIIAGTAITPTDQVPADTTVTDAIATNTGYVAPAPGVNTVSPGAYAPVDTISTQYDNSDWTRPAPGHGWAVIDGRYQLVPTSQGIQPGGGTIYTPNPISSPGTGGTIGGTGGTGGTGGNSNGAYPGYVGKTDANGNPAPYLGFDIYDWDGNDSFLTNKEIDELSGVVSEVIGRDYDPRTDVLTEEERNDVNNSVAARLAQEDIYHNNQVIYGPQTGNNLTSATTGNVTGSSVWSKIKTAVTGDNSYVFDSQGQNLADKAGSTKNDDGTFDIKSWYPDVDDIVLKPGGGNNTTTPTVTTPTVVTPPPTNNNNNDKDSAGTAAIKAANRAQLTSNVQKQKNETGDDVHDGWEEAQGGYIQKHNQGGRVSKLPAWMNFRNRYGV